MIMADPEVKKGQRKISRDFDWWADVTLYVLYAGGILMTSYGLLKYFLS